MLASNGSTLNNRPLLLDYKYVYLTVTKTCSSISFNSSHFITFRWDDLGKLVTTGDIIRMTKGYVNVWKNCLTLYLAKISEFQKVNEFCMVFSELPFMRYVYLYY